jgi:uncharacterized OB-fold protein
MRLLDPKLLRVTGESWDLVGQRCNDCGMIAYPRKRVCPRCFSSDLGEHLLSKHGTLHTYTTTYLGSPSLQAPYSIGFLDLPEGLKLMGMIRIEQPADDKLAVGMAMKIVFDVLRTDPDGEPVYSYMLAPAEELSA